MNSDALPDGPFLFYDGGCALCHRAVRLLLRWERPGSRPGRALRFASLDGLRDLPRLRRLLADDNRLTDAAAADGLPALEIVNLNGNRLERFPRLVSRMPRHLWQDNPGARR